MHKETSSNYRQSFTGPSFSIKFPNVRTKYDPNYTKILMGSSIFSFKNIVILINNLFINNIVLVWNNTKREFWHKPFWHWSHTLATKSITPINERFVGTLFFFFSWMQYIYWKFYIGKNSYRLFQLCRESCIAWL